MANLGFAGKLVYGGADVGALLPVTPDCNHRNVPAASVDEALAHDGAVHGSWGLDLHPGDLLAGKPVVTNHCGDLLRQQIVQAVQVVNQANSPSSNADGYPDFKDWPRWNDITHQSMWIDWIKRAHDLGGLSVMVALAVNNETLADAVRGPGDGPDDDMASADLQIAEIKALVERPPNKTWMEIAYSSADLRRIVYNHKLAVVLGVEVDNLGNFNRKADVSEADVRAEIARLRDEGVRYLFPIHVIDNRFGTTAAFIDLFNLSNLREAGHFWNLQCSRPEDKVTYQYKLGNPLNLVNDVAEPPSGIGGTTDVELGVLMATKLGMLSDTFDQPVIPKVDPQKCPGMMNVGNPDPGLTPLGKFAVAEMMRQGLLIDIDHMSQASRADAFAIASASPVPYPLNSGHNSVRAVSGGISEFFLTADEYKHIGEAHGIAAVGGARATDEEWVRRYQAIASALGSAAPGALAFGTDANGVIVTIDKPNGHRFDYSSFPKSTLGAMSWDYNDVGVAHYGMLADFMHGLPTLPGGNDVVTGLMSGAEYFAATWEIAEAYARKQGADAGPALRAAAAAAVSCAPGTKWVHSCQKCLRPREPCPTLAAPHCDDTRSLDPWGLCMTAKAKKAAPAAPAPPPPAAGAAAPSLAAGEYTLVLAYPGSSADGSADVTKVFDVDVVPSGGRLELRSHGARAGAKEPTLRGGFRGTHFLMRLGGSDRVLVLTAVGIAKGPLTEIMGGYAVHAPTHNQPEARTGTFLLTKTAASGAAPLTDLGPYLAQQLAQ
jgi:microsomal dipeptidase-like Zn-dependent dipeptidase